MKYCILLFIFLASTQAVENCWKNAYGRGVGTVPDSCQPGNEKNGALCYPICKDGFYGVGPVCW